jgi:hypothetical protein
VSCTLLIDPTQTAQGFAAESSCHSKTIQI